MAEKTIQLEIPLLLPELPDAGDSCLVFVQREIEKRKGITYVHVNDEQEPVTLCLHYNPDLISATAVQQFAEQAGSDFTARYRHQQIPFSGIITADAATTLASVLQELPGMLHANVNYAAGLIFVAYDTTRLGPDTIEKSIKNMGARPLVAGKDKKNVHDHAPTFLPRWMKERWTILLVVLAGIFFLIGWIGETFLDMPENLILFFFILSYIAGGYDIATSAVPGLLKGKFDTDVLMLAAAAGAALLNEWAEGAFLLFLFSLGHAGEHFALDRARNAVNALGELMPKTARVRRGDDIREEPVEQLQVGDIVLVRPGDRVPIDGAITRGRSAIDQSPITGESVPVSKGEGEEVFAGTINQEASLDVRVNKLAQDNTLSRVMQMVAEAQSQQSPTQRTTERFTAVFVPAVLIFVLLAIIVPPLLGWESWSDSFYRGMLLLVAASPCALAIGTPAAVLAGIAQAARNGVLIKGGVHLENLGLVKAIAFDKTGTLTSGQFAVTDIVPLNGADQDQLLCVAAAVEEQSRHPLAGAVVRAAQERGLDLPEAEGLQDITGLGVRSTLDGRPVLIGSSRLFQEQNGRAFNEQLAQTMTQLEDQGKTTMAVQVDGEFLGVLALADEARDGVGQILQKLLDLGVKKLVMLTGDNQTVASEIGRRLGLTDIRAGLLPEQKLKAIKALQEEYGSVAMAGDGVNDAPALATATVGIAMGGAGTAVALETADVALMADDLSRLPFAVGLSRASRSIIVQNLAISLGVIAVLFLTSVFGLVKLSGAVILHEGSTILVVLNALRLLRYH